MQGMQIRIARIKRQLRQVDVAQRAGISQPALSRIERGYLTPSEKTLRRIRRAIHEGDIPT